MTAPTQDPNRQATLGKDMIVTVWILIKILLLILLVQSGTERFIYSGF